MNPPYAIFDRSKLHLKPRTERADDLQPGFVLPLEPKSCANLDATALLHLKQAATAIGNATANKANVLFMLGGHVIRSGVQRYLLDLMKRGHIQGIAVNGAVAIHDFEIACSCSTTESVARYIKTGEFGLWQETGVINDIVRGGVADGLGFGESLGREIVEGSYPHKDLSLFACAWNCGVPITVHVGIGYDIIHEHPNCDGAALGAASYRDFLIFAQLVQGLEGGVLASFGSAVMAPEVFLKALSMARNVSIQEGKDLRHFTTLVCDLVDLPASYSEEAKKDDPLYYFRPWKTLLARTVASGGQSLYVNGRHEYTIPCLWQYVITSDSIATWKIHSA